MLTNLFIIDSPLQLLNAIEAKEYFRTDNNILVIIFYKNHNQRHRNQIKNILKVYAWENILVVDPVHSRSKFFQIINLVKKLKINKYKYIFCGNISKSQNAVITSLQYEELYLIDDGVATINIYERGNIVNFGNRLKDKIKLLRYKLFGMNIKPIDNMSFFTALNLLSKNDTKVVKNNYNYLRNKSKSFTFTDDIIYLVGQNFVKVKSLSDEEYIYYLNLLKNRYKGKKIIYLPHREESINEKYEKLFDETFELVYFDNNIEMEFYLKNIYPSTVIGFISSALTTLKCLFPKTDIIAIKPDNKSLQQRFAHVYNYFEADNIKIQLLESV